MPAFRFIGYLRVGEIQNPFRVFAEVLECDGTGGQIIRCHASLAQIAYHFFQVRFVQNMSAQSAIRPTVRAILVTGEHVAQQNAAGDCVIVSERLLLELIPEVAQDHSLTGFHLFTYRPGQRRYGVRRLASGGGLHVLNFGKIQETRCLQTGQNALELGVTLLFGVFALSGNPCQGRALITAFISGVGDNDTFRRVGEQRFQDMRVNGIFQMRHAVLVFELMKFLIPIPSDNLAA